MVKDSCLLQVWAPAAICQNKSWFMCYRWMTTWKLTETISYFLETNISVSPPTSHTPEKTMGSKMYKPHAVMQTCEKRQRMRWKDKRTWTWLQNAHLQVFNQNHMWLHMPSYAAVMAWPLNSVTNLLFLWKPQTINHSVQSGGLSWKFNTSSLSNGCTYVSVWDALLLGAIFGAQVS